jgi:protein O-GlcNAc transferase
MGNVLVELKRAGDALPCYERAIALQPDFADALVNMGHALNVLSRPQDAVACYGRAKAIDADAPWLCGTWLYTRMRMCDWRDIDAAFVDPGQRIDRGERAAVPFTMLAAPLTAEQQQKCSIAYVDSMRFAQARPLPSHVPHERVRVGYFSADFHDHATAHLMAELFERHDRYRFEVIAFSFGPRSRRRMRERLEAAFDQFVDVASLSDAEVIDRARDADRHRHRPHRLYGRLPHRHLRRPSSADTGEFHGLSGHHGRVLR